MEPNSTEVADRTAPLIQEETPSLDKAMTTVPRMQPVTGDSVMGLLHAALAPEVDVEKLERLVALQERWEAREAVRQFFAALAKFQSECPPIVKNSKATITSGTKGTGFSYDYAKQSAIIRVAGPHLRNNGFSHSFDMVVVNGMCTTTCTLRHVAGHSISSSFTAPTDSNSGASPQQKFEIADSYAQRRSFTAVTGINTTSADEAGEEIDPTPIDEDQVVILDDLIREVGVNRVSFLKMMEVQSLAEIRAVDYETALAAIEDYRAAKARKKAAT